MSNTRFCGLKNWVILHELEGYAAVGAPHEEISSVPFMVSAGELIDAGTFGRCQTSLISSKHTE